MEALLVSAGIVAIGEIGDKTQLLALLLAARFRRPWPIVLGILTATLLNHAAAGLLGNWLRVVVAPDTLRVIVGIGFIAIALWALVPDKLDEKEAGATSALAIFGTTVLSFFFAEIGDKTQVATVMLAARFEHLVPVVVGTTLGMLIADVPAVFLAGRMGRKLPLKAIRYVAAALFVALGAWTLLAR